MSYFKENSPTNLEILEAIYNRFYDSFISYKDNNEVRESKIYVPIDIEKISNDLKVDEDIIFGRLHYHLENKYGYINKNEKHVYFFANKFGNDNHCVNFPYLSAVLSKLRDRNNKYVITQIIAITALIISIISLFII
ncbi:MAG: hypothetical protein ACOCV1_06950 [Bacillota bacterium]